MTTESPHLKKITIMDTHDDYQERLPEHPEPLELPEYPEPKRVAAAHHAAKPRPAVTADVDEVRGMSSVGWAALAALAIAVFVGAIFFFSGRAHDVDGTVTAYNASAVPARNVAASDIASTTPAQAVATNVATAPQDVVYLFPLDGSDIAENKALNGVAKRAAETGAYVTVVAYTDESGRAAYNQRLSEKRAKKVGAYLVAHGVPADHVKTQGLGQTHKYPTVAQNRRAEVHVSK